MPTYDSGNISAIHRKLHSDLPSDSALRVKALESVLVEKGLLEKDAIDSWIEKFSEDIGPKNGARVIARSWLDPDFAARLRNNGIAAFEELGYDAPVDYQLKTVFNSATTHNLVVCTLCSCYPMYLIGMSPSWYKSNEYRARAVRDPRGVLAEFGVEIGDDVEVQVWDSTSERRYLVVPERPSGTDGWSEDELAALVTRNAMIGTHRNLSPTSEAA